MSTHKAGRRKLQRVEYVYSRFADLVMSTVYTERYLSWQVSNRKFGAYLETKILKFTAGIMTSYKGMHVLSTLN